MNNINNSISKYKQNSIRMNTLYRVLIIIFSWLFISIFASIIVFLFIEGLDGFKSIFSTTKWDYVNNYGVLPLLVGTLFVTIIAVIIATPLAVFSSLLINEFFNKRLKVICNSFIELLAGIPSVIYGFFGIMFFISNQILSYSVLLAGIILAFMILPNILHFCNVGINSIPQYVRDGSITLGANRVETTFKIILPSARKGISAGIMMGIARAFGETMAVTMIIGNSSNLPAAHDFFTKFFSMFLLMPNNTMAAAIATNFLESSPEQISILYSIAFILFVIVTFFNLGSILYLHNSFKNIKNNIKNYINVYKLKKINRTSSLKEEK